MSECPYAIGNIKTFVPSSCGQATAGFVGELTREVSGPVVQIHEAHRWYRVEYQGPAGTQHECFKF